MRKLSGEISQKELEEQLRDDEQMNLGIGTTTETCQGGE